MQQPTQARVQEADFDAVHPPAGRSLSPPVPPEWCRGVKRSPGDPHVGLRVSSAVRVHLSFHRQCLAPPPTSRALCLSLALVRVPRGTGLKALPCHTAAEVAAPCRLRLGAHPTPPVRRGPRAARAPSSVALCRCSSRPHGGCGGCRPLRVPRTPPGACATGGIGARSASPLPPIGQIDCVPIRRAARILTRSKNSGKAMFRTENAGSLSNSAAFAVWTWFPWGRVACRVGHGNAHLRSGAVPALRSNAPSGLSKGELWPDSANRRRDGGGGSGRKQGPQGHVLLGALAVHFRTPRPRAWGVGTGGINTRTGGGGVVGGKFRGKFSSLRKVAKLRDVGPALGCMPGGQPACPPRAA